MSYAGAICSFLSHKSCVRKKGNELHQVKNIIFFQIHQENVKNT